MLGNAKWCILDIIIGRLIISWMESNWNMWLKRDLGVIISEDLKWEKQCSSAVSKANRILGMIKQNFIDRCEGNSFVIVYKSGKTTWNISAKYEVFSTVRTWSCLSKKRFDWGFQVYKWGLYYWCRCTGWANKNRPPYIWANYIFQD